MRLKNKVAIVTGGARGIGAAISRAYVQEGARTLIEGDFAPDGTPRVKMR